jgi:HlyD family secretion protein
MAEARLTMRRAIPFVAIVLFLFGGWAFRNKVAADRQGDWIAATRGDIVTGIEVTGTLAAVQSDTLGPPMVSDVWDFKISMLAPEGSDVKKGRPVIGFDSTELQRRLEEKSAESEQARKQIEKKRSDIALLREDERLELAQAEAQVRKTSMKLEAPPDLLGSKDRKQVQLDYNIAKREAASLRSRLSSHERAASAEIRLLESKQQQAAATVKEMQDAIQRMNVVAPRDGTLVYVTNWRGDKKKIGDTCWRNEKIVEIPDLRQMYAKGEVDESDAGKIATGQRVSFRLDARPDDEVHGTITTVGKTVQPQPNTRNPLKILRVDIALDRTDPAVMRPGMRFKGTVELARARNVVLVPRDAVFISERGPAVYVRRMLSVDTVPVRIGRENEQSVEVVSGVRAGDRVLIAKPEKPEAKS